MKIDINVTANIHVHSVPPDLISDISTYLKLLHNQGEAAQKQLALVIQQEKKIMSTLAQVVDLVAEEDTEIDSVLTLLDQLAAQVSSLQPNQASIDALASDITAKRDAIAAAVLKNTPSAPPPATPPPTETPPGT